MKVFSVRKENILVVIYLFIIFFGLASTIRNEVVPAFSMPLSKKIVLIDPGHGGWDPGTVSKQNDLEKDINLQISLKLQQFLEQGGAFVLTTRTEDEALSKNKSGDMQQRKTIANTTKADILVSIHQNSHPSSKAQGAQVYYFNNSDKSQLLADSVQAQLVSFVDPTNKRLSESSASYYVLKQTTLPAVLVECGFMSNYAELKKLQDDEYQSKIAWAIYMGIIDYFNSDKYK
jgi:N-acetylmuramoyl-L-alanine amidase